MIVCLTYGGAACACDTVQGTATDSSHTDTLISGDSSQKTTNHCPDSVNAEHDQRELAQNIEGQGSLEGAAYGHCSNIDCSNSCGAESAQPVVADVASALVSVFERDDSDPLFIETAATSLTPSAFVTPTPSILSSIASLPDTPVKRYDRALK